MRLLLAEDDPAASLAMQSLLADWGYDVATARDGRTALTILEGPDAPPLVLMDWMMPGVDGLEVCRRIRARPTSVPPYIILLTARDTEEDLVAGLGGGASDFVSKPVNPLELRARLQAGSRVVELQMSLARRVRDLEEAMARVKQLHGLLPICMYCKKVRDDHNYWRQVEEYLSAFSDARFSHSICPGCYDSVVRPELDSMGIDDTIISNGRSPT